MSVRLVCAQRAVCGLRRLFGAASYSALRSVFHQQDACIVPLIEACSYPVNGLLCMRGDKQFSFSIFAPLGSVPCDFPSSHLTFLRLIRACVCACAATGDSPALELDPSNTNVKESLKVRALRCAAVRSHSALRGRRPARGHQWVACACSGGRLSCSLAPACPGCNPGTCTMRGTRGSSDESMYLRVCASALTPNCVTSPLSSLCFTRWGTARFALHCRQPKGNWTSSAAASTSSATSSSSSTTASTSTSTSTSSNSNSRGHSFLSSLPKLDQQQYVLTMLALCYHVKEVLQALGVQLFHSAVQSLMICNRQEGNCCVLYFRAPLCF